LTNQLTARTGFIDSYDSAGIGHITLDTLVAECGFVPDVVKIDIEGWEVEALGGAANLLSSRKPSLIIEVHSADLEKECLVLLADHDYSTEIVDPRRFIPDYRLLAGNRWIIAT
jgi:hypothetical protein